MKPTCFACIPNPWFRRDYPSAPDGIPRGNILELSVNPHNGQIVVAFQRSDTAIELVEFAIESIDAEFGRFRDFACPLIEAEPRYLLRAVV